MGHKPPVGYVHVGGCCADPSELLPLDYQRPSVVGICGNSENSRPAEDKMKPKKKVQDQAAEERKRRNKFCSSGCLQPILMCWKMTALNQGVV